MEGYRYESWDMVPIYALGRVIIKVCFMHEMWEKICEGDVDFTACCMHPPSECFVWI